MHHDLQTVRSYFDWLFILNVRAIAQGPVAQVYTAANLHKAYGGQIALLDASALAQPGPARAEIPETVRRG